MAAEAVEQPDREHVTMFAIRRPGRFRLGNLRQDVDRSHLRWTVDTAPDRSLSGESSRPCPRRVRYEDILSTLGGHPAWAEINAGVQATVVDRTPVLV